MNYKTEELYKININEIKPYQYNCKTHNRKNIDSIKTSI